MKTIYYFSGQFLSIYSKFFRPVLMILLLSMLSISISAGDPTEPSPVEKAAFDAKLERLKSNESLHTHPLVEILESLNGPIHKMIECPPTSEVQKVIFNIETKHIKFDRNLMINNMPVAIGARDIGWYQWNYSQTIEDGMKIITACNYIMLDSAIMIQQEADPPIGPIGDEGLLFHELLHGQLVIDSIMSNPSYQQKVCNCNFDLTASDVVHDHIPSLEESYLAALFRKLGVEDPEVHVIDPPAQQADEDGKFEIEVADIEILNEKENVSIQPYAPKGSNVDISSVGFVEKDGKLYVTGMLIDKSKPGLILVIIDPPSVFLFVGLEKAIQILPAPDIIPTLSQWGIVILLLTIVIIGWVSLIGYRRIETT